MGHQIKQKSREIIPIGHHSLAVFDLNTDPDEYVNIIDTPHGREVLEWAVDRHASLKEDA